MSERLVEGVRLSNPDKILQEPLGEKDVHLPQVQSVMRDWLDCIKSRGVPRSDIASMYQTTATCHLANIAYVTGEKLVWSKEKDTIINSRKAKECLAYERDYRKPWRLPMHRS